MPYLYDKTLEKCFMSATEAHVINTHALRRGMSCLAMITIHGKTLAFVRVASTEIVMSYISGFIRRKYETFYILFIFSVPPKVLFLILLGIH